MSLRSELLNDNEDPIITSLKKLTSIPFQDVVDNSLKQSDSSADNQLVNRLTFITKDDFTPIKNAIEPLELKKLHNKELTAREYFVLGNFYDFFLKYYENAISCYQKAEERGDSGASNNLGFMYLEGIGVKKDLIKAKQYLEKAAEKGIKLAEVNLFHYYSEIKDYNTAEFWIKKSLVTKDNNICSYSHVWYAEYLETKNDLPSRTEARRHYQIAAENGDISSLWQLAMIYTDNNKLDPNLNLAKQYYKFLIPYSPSLTTSSPEAQLGIIYFLGLANIEKNYRLAADFYEKLIASDYYEKLSKKTKLAIYKNIAEIYKTGSKDFKRDLNKAARYFLKIHELGDMTRYNFAEKLYYLLKDTYGQEYENCTEVRFYLELYSCSRKNMMGTSNRNTVYYVKNVINKLIDESKLHQFDVLVEENLNYMQTYIDVEKNEFHRQLMARIIKNLEERDDTIVRLINKGPACIVSQYLIGEEGHKTKLHYQSFFAHPKNNINTIKEEAAILSDSSKLSL